MLPPPLISSLVIKISIISPSLTSSNT
jgi:hypothetical protein